MNWSKGKNENWTVQEDIIIDCTNQNKKWSLHKRREEGSAGGMKRLETRVRGDL